MPQIKKIRVLVTGFGPFPGVRSNPSETLLELIGRRKIRQSGRIELQSALIPTFWREIEKFTSGTLAEFDPDIAVHFGVHSRATGLRIEQLARNCTCPHADASGARTPRHRVVDAAPRSLKSTLDTHRLVSKLNALGLPAQCSGDAGRYLCNALLFASLHQAAARPAPRQTGFIHIPKTQPSLLQNGALLKGAALIIEHCVARHIHRTLSEKASGG